MADLRAGMKADGLDELYRAHWGRTVAVASHLLGDRSAAEDIVQEAFVRLADELDTVDDPGPWLRTVTYRRALNELRRRDRERAAISRHAATVTDSYPAELVDPIDARLAAALGQLRGNQRAAVLLCWVDEVSTAEAAGTIGCSAATVRVHLHRARKALGHALEEEHT